LVRILKIKDITRKEAVQYKRTCNAHLLVILDIMMFSVIKEQSAAFFNLINLLNYKTALIITANKSPKQWAEIRNDTVLTRAILDEILYRCEIVKFSKNSLRKQNRKPSFMSQKNQYF
jgi:DNA replication protein DnaC